MDAYGRESSPSQEAGTSTVTPVRPRRFRVGYNADETAGFKKHLDEYGYAVAASVAGPEEVETARELMWQFLEGKGKGQRTTGVSRSDVSTWADEDSDDGKDGGRRRWPGDDFSGIVCTNGVGHAPFMWYLRLLPGVSEAFAAVWGVRPDELLTSFDGANVFRPWRYDPEWKTKGGWYHVDQNAYNPGKDGQCCVQGIITLMDANETTGGLVLVPGSHRNFQGVCERYADKPPQGCVEFIDYVSLDAGDEVLAEGARLVCAQAGDLVVWDSRTVHCNMPALDGVETVAAPSSDSWELLRMVGYVCMTPAAWATDDVLERRWDAFVNHVTTTHWPHTFAMHSAGPYGMPKNDPATISDQQRKLIGGAVSPPASVTAEPLTKNEQEARRLMELAEDAEGSGDCKSAMRLYQQAYKLDPRLEFPND